METILPYIWLRTVPLGQSTAPAGAPIMENGVRVWKEYTDIDFGKEWLEKKRE